MYNIIMLVHSSNLITKLKNNFAKDLNIFNYIFICFCIFCIFFTLFLSEKTTTFVSNMLLDPLKKQKIELETFIKTQKNTKKDIEKKTKRNDKDIQQIEVLDEAINQHTKFLEDNKNQQELITNDLLKFQQKINNFLKISIIIDIIWIILLCFIPFHLPQSFIIALVILVVLILLFVLSIISNGKTLVIIFGLLSLVMIAVVSIMMSGGIFYFAYLFIELLISDEVITPTSAQTPNTPETITKETENKEEIKI